MLLVDKIIECVPGVRSVGLKNVTVNEPFFQGHYPGRPIMPGVLIVESIAQAGAVILLSDPHWAGSIPLIGAIESVKFRRQVVPGDQLRLEVVMDKIKGSIGKMSGKATVDGEVVAELVLTFKLVPGA